MYLLRQTQFEDWTLTINKLFWSKRDEHDWTKTRKLIERIVSNLQLGSTDVVSKNWYVWPDYTQETT